MVLKGRITSACLALTISALFFVGSVVFSGTTPRFELVQRIKQLERQNEKLHGNIRALTEGVGGTDPGRALEKQTKDDVYWEMYGEQQYYHSKPSLSRCETIHVAIVAAGYNTSRGVVALVKSILFHRHNPLHFHFISDKAARHVLGTLFRTWQLPGVDVSFYRTEVAETSISWIPNAHYSGTYGLMKLTLTNVLPSQLDKVIVLDTDVMFAADIAGLWEFFKLIRKGKKLLGVVENQSNWYLGKLWENHRPWPAVGRGFNTGVMLLDLEAMRQQMWTAVWTQVAAETLQSYKATALADQDIINAVIKNDPYIHYILPCAWNVQLSEHALSEYCYREAEEFKVIHWNSPKKLQVTNNHGPYFRSLYHAFQQYNGDLLRDELLSCAKSEESERENPSDQASTDPCHNFRREAGIVHRTHLFFVEFDYTSTDSADVTLTAQLSMDRLHMLGPLCRHWEGPMSITVYATDSEAQQFLQYTSTVSVLQDRKNIGFHIVYRGATTLYPVNYLRNVALENVITPYVFLSDIDFVPMQGLYEYLKEAIRVLGLGKKERAFVVPAFETLLYRFDFPKDKQELLQMLSEKSVYTFRQDIWPKGHAPTNYKHWKTATVPYIVHWAPDFEPYIAVSRNVTQYDTRFVGFGWNKVSQIMELNAQGYEFVVLPDGFIIHLPHSPSVDITSFRDNKHYRDCVQVLKKEFQRDINH